MTLREGLGRPCKRRLSSGQGNLCLRLEPIITMPNLIRENNLLCVGGLTRLPTLRTMPRICADLILTPTNIKATDVADLTRTIPATLLTQWLMDASSTVRAVN